MWKHQEYGADYRQRQASETLGISRAGIKLHLKIIKVDETCRVLTLSRSHIPPLIHCL